MKLGVHNVQSHQWTTWQVDKAIIDSGERVQPLTTIQLFASIYSESTGSLIFQNVGALNKPDIKQVLIPESAS